MDGLAKVVGGVLRFARLDRGLTLEDVGERSGGRFRPSTVGSYERGDRAISLRMFLELADFYRVPGDQLLSRVIDEMNPTGRIQLVIDLNRLVLLEERERRVLAEFIHRVRGQRGDYLSDVITLRAGDVEVMALSAGLKPSALIAKVQAAVFRLPAEE